MRLRPWRLETNGRLSSAVSGRLVRSGFISFVILVATLVNSLILPDSTHSQNASPVVADGQMLQSFQSSLGPPDCSAFDRRDLAVPPGLSALDLVRAQTLQAQELTRLCWAQTGAAAQLPPGGLTAEDATRVLVQDVLGSVGQRAGYLWPRPVTGTDHIDSRARQVWPLAQAQADSWFIWIDEGPHTAAFAHPTRFFFIEVETGRYTLLNDWWWPTINGQEVWARSQERVGSPDRIFGFPTYADDDLLVTAAQALSGPPTVTADTLTGPTCQKGRRFAAILVLDDEGAFTTNGQKVWNHLNTAYPAGTFSKIYYATPRNVSEATHYWQGFGQLEKLNALFDELARDLNECDTLFIHISAHNGVSNVAGTEKVGLTSIPISKFEGDMGSNHVSGTKLAEWLAKIKCCRITLVLDICEAGIMVPYVKPYVTEVVTAADVGQSAIFSYWTGGAFTNKFIDGLKHGKDLKGSSEGSMGGGLQSAWTQQLKEFFGKATVWDSDVQDSRVTDGDRACPCDCGTATGGGGLVVPRTPAQPGSTGTPTPTFTPTQQRTFGGIGGSLGLPPETPTPTPAISLRTSTPTLTPSATPPPTDTPVVSSPTLTASSTPPLPTLPPTEIIPTEIVPTVPSTPTSTFSPTPSRTPSVTPTRTSTPTATFTPTPTPSPSITPTSPPSGPIGVGSGPYPIAIDPSLGLAFVGNQNSNDVSVIDVLTNTVVATIPVGTLPLGIAVNPVTHRVYVTNFLGNTMTVIDGTTRSVVTTVSEPSSPIAVDVDPTLNRIYIVRNGDGRLRSIDGATNQTITSVVVGNNPVAVAFNSASGLAYVANFADNTVAVVNTVSMTLVTTIPVGRSPDGIAVNPLTNRVYVSNFTDNTVSVINTLTGAVIATIPVGVAPDGIGIAQSSNHVYVANSGAGTVTEIDGNTNSVIRTISAGTGPSQVAVDDTRHRVYVTNQGSNNVSVFPDQ